MYKKFYLGLQRKNSVMKIAAVVATGLNNAIGKNNELLWKLPNDLKFFKATTMGFPIIMGRKTYESVGKPLPGRKNIIITRDGNYKVEGVEIFHSIEEALKNCGSEQVFIVGGAEIYKQTLPLVDTIYRTLVKSNFEADAFFPEINTNEFELAWEEEHHADEKHNYDYSFQKWIRKN